MRHGWNPDGGCCGKGACSSCYDICFHLDDGGILSVGLLGTLIAPSLKYTSFNCLQAWSTNGWGFKWGVLDYAGGGPVEIGSGIGGLAYSWVLGRRREKELINFRPHNVRALAAASHQC